MKQRKWRVKVTALLLPLMLVFLLLGSCGGSTVDSGTDGSEVSGGATTAYEPGDTDSTDDAGETTAPNGSNNQTGSNGSNKTNSNKTNSNKTSSNSNATTKQVNTKGYTFSVISSLLPSKKSSDNTLFEKLFFDRVAEVEKELGCKIKVINTLQVNVDTLAPMIQAGKKVGDVLEVELRWMPQLISAGYLKPWNEIQGINVNDEKYTAAYTRLATIGGKNWGLQFMKPPEVRFAVYMNKTLLKSSGVDADGIYKLVEQKKWDFETFREYAKKATKVSNGVTQTYGFGGRPDYVIQELMAANNAFLVSVDKNGKGTPTYTSDNIKYSLRFFNQLVNEDKVFYYTDGMKKQETYAQSLPVYYNEFIQGKIAFLFEDSWVLNQQIKPRVKNFEYGMIPIPMGPSASDYVSPSNHARVFVVTSTNKDLDVTAKIFDALAKPPSGYSGKDWWLEDVQLDYFQDNDKQSLKIYQMMLEKSMWDMGLGISALSDGFHRTAVFGPIFWNSGKTTDAAIDSIKGVYDDAVKKVFK